MRPSMRQRGAALTEFAVVLPLFLAAVYGALYLADVGVAKLKAQEVARYSAFTLATRAQSDYSGEFEHHEKFEATRDAVLEEVAEVYFDLDGAVDRELSVPGRHGKTMSAALNEASNSDLREEETGWLPEYAEAQWAEPLSELGIALNLLGVGTGTEDVLADMVERVRMNHKGQVTARAEVEILPPVRAEDALVQRRLASFGGRRGADLSDWNPRGQTIRDSGGERMHLTLIADSWRVTEGVSALPKIADRQYATAVMEVGDRAFAALPVGPVIDVIMDLLYDEDIPDPVRQFLGQGEATRARVVARPYTARREEPAYRGTEQRGQLDVFTYAGGEAEGGAVTNFESLPIFDDARAPRESELLKSLNARGPNFMGCKQPERRGCWE